MCPRASVRRAGGAKTAFRSLPRDVLSLDCVVPVAQQERLSESDLRPIESEPNEGRTMSDAAGPLTEVSAAAQRAIRNAQVALRPYADEPRVAALVQKLTAISSPEGSFERDDEISKALIHVESLAKGEDASAAVRDRASQVSMELQRAHLSRHSGGAHVWERAAREAGRAA